MLSYLPLDTLDRSRNLFLRPHTLLVEDPAERVVLVTTDPDDPLLVLLALSLKPRQDEAPDEVWLVPRLGPQQVGPVWAAHIDDGVHPSSVSDSTWDEHRRAVRRALL